MDPLFDLPALIRSTWERLPRRVWLALGVALVALVVDVRQSHLGNPGVPFDVSTLAGILVPPLYCLLAAALWLGIRSWRSGRRIAEWAAGLFLVAGVLELILRVMILTRIGMAMTGTDPTNYALLLRSLVESVAVLGAGALLAVGLWKGHGPLSRVDRSVLLAFGALAIVSGSLMIAADAYLTTFPNVSATFWAWPLNVLYSAWVVSLVAVGGSAVVRPWRFRAAQLAVGIGALGMAAVRATETQVIWFAHSGGAGPMWLNLVDPVLVGCSLVFLLLLAAGLFVSAEQEPGTTEVTAAVP